jgi:opacity protein-like surface antigen
MKLKFIAAVCATILYAASADAQLGVTKKIVPVSFGVKLGVNMQKTNGDFIGTAYESGILGGAFVSINKKKKGIRVEALVKSAKIEFSTVAVAYKTVCLDVPILFEYAPIKRLKLHAGPQLTTVLSASKNGSDAKSDLASMDIAAAAGFEVNLPFKLTLGGRYIKGLLDMNNTNIAGTGKWRSSTLQFSVGYRFLN